MFTKNDLKTGMIVETRNGNYWLVLRNHVCDECDMIVEIGACHGFRFDYLNDDLTSKETSGRDIMRVTSPSVFPNLGEPYVEFGHKVLFDRQNVEKKKMTVAEVCKELGYEVEIIKG